MENASKNLKNKMLEGSFVPTSKPDCDNCVKIILDSLNDVAYVDDSQVFKLEFEKKFSDLPRVEVILSNFTN